MGDLSCASGFGRGGVEISAVICACDCDSECVGIYKCEGFGSVAFLRGDVGARPPESGVMLLRLAVLAVDTCTARPSNVVKTFLSSRIKLNAKPVEPGSWGTLASERFTRRSAAGESWEGVDKGKVAGV